MGRTGMADEDTAVSARSWRFRGRRLLLDGRIRIMGIVNVTPDSFSDGGRWAEPSAAAERAVALREEGADIVDIGGESTRPGAAEVPAAEEIRRVVPVLRAARAACPDAVLSVDTRKARVAAAALEAGADIVNDVSALGDPAMAGVVREAGAGLVLMHMLGTPETMQRNPVYNDVVDEVQSFLAARAAAAVAQGIARERIVLDPGIGFGKSPDHNLALLQGLDALAAPGFPLLVGVSRKSLVGVLTGRPVGEREAGSLALLAWLALHGAAVARVHDVRASVDVARVFARMQKKERAAHDMA